MPTSPMNEVIQFLRSAVLLPEGMDLTDGQLLECFVTRREPAALEALVWRHGPMVWGVCHRILGKFHDAEDAFQATFLVLVRKAASIYPRAKVGNWLYGVAHQTALKARATRTKRQVRERQVPMMPEPAVQERDHWSNLQPVLDQEVSRLPEKYRTVIVLCDLESMTGRMAARHLDLPEGTVASRLARARTMLAKRLARHGLPVSGGALAAVLSQKAESAPVPPPVVTSMIKAMTPVAAGRPAAGVISLKVVALADGVMKTMLLTKIIKVAAVLLLLAVIGFGAELYMRQMAGAQQGPSTKPATEGENYAGAKQPGAKGGEKLKEDTEKLQDTWQLVSCATDGDMLPREILIGRKIVIEKDKFIEVDRAKKLAPFVFVLNTISEPKAIDATPLEGEFKELRKHLGIYALESDTLKLCFSKPGDKRPNDFTCTRPL